MNLSTLIKQYFPLAGSDITIDVFDEKNIYDVYQRVVNVLTQHIDIETTVLQAMSYCFYEILDNVLTHSGKEMGTVITHYNADIRWSRIHYEKFPLARNHHLLATLHEQRNQPGRSGSQPY